MNKFKLLASIILISIIIYLTFYIGANYGFETGYAIGYANGYNENELCPLEACATLCNLIRQYVIV